MNANGKLHILWSSNNFTAPSGYGMQTKEFMLRLKATGYDMSLAANYGVQGSPFQTPDGITVYPSVADPSLNDVLFGHYQSARAELLITLYDPHAYNPDILKQMPWCAWAPVDSTPLLPANTHALKAARWIWSMSGHGDKMLREAGFSNVSYVPHGIDTHLFTPGNRAEARRKLSSIVGVNMIDKFVVAMNSANKGAPSRKGFYEAFAGFKPFVDAHPDAVLYMHTELSGVFQGEHLPAIAAMVGIDPARVVYAPQYQLVCGMLLPEYLVDVYNTADVLLTTSHGEGFGIPVVEAQACGCPVLTTDCTALVELCMAGRLIKARDYMPVVGTTWRRPEVEDVTAALEWAYTQRGNEVLRSAARTKALFYDADRVFADYMLPAVERMQSELYAVPEPKRVLKKRRAVTEHSNGKPKDEIMTEIADAMRRAL